jgi:hypothetical protein
MRSKGGRRNDRRLAETVGVVDLAPAASVMRPSVCRGVAVSMAVFQPSPEPTPAISLDSPLDLTCTNSTRRHQVDGEHPPTDLAVGGFESLPAR